MKIYEIEYKKEPLLGTFWDYLTIGCCIIIPAATYFSLLENLARNLESEELKKIEYKRLKASTLKERNYLIQYMSEVRSSLRTVSIIDYAARLILVTYLGIFVKEFSCNQLVSNKNNSTELKNRPPPVRRLCKSR